MTKKALNYLFVLLFPLFCANLHAQNVSSLDKYKTNADVRKTLYTLQQKSPNRTSLHKIAKSSESGLIYAIEIGKGEITSNYNSQKAGNQ
jgi:hypothetical protein